MAKKKSTADILAQLRSQDSGGKPAAPADSAAREIKPPEGGAADESSPPAEPEVPAAEAAETPATEPAPKPKSTKDILARLRSEAKGGGEPAPPAKRPAAETEPVEKAVVKTPPSGPVLEKLSPQEMLKALREKQAKQTAPEVAEPAAEKKKPARAKPAAARRKPAPVGEPDQARRNVLLAILAAPLVLIATPFAAAWTFFTTATAAFTLALARFMMPNVLVEPPSQFKVGSPSDYPAGTVATKWKAEYGVWIVNTEYEGRNMIYALFSICTHLGCTPNWLEGEQKFKCPCHGSGFYINGINFEGPAPRPLERAAIRIAPDGMLEVDKSQKFQQELGQWEDAKSYIELA